MVHFGYPYNDLVICKDSTDYLVEYIVFIHVEYLTTLMNQNTWSLYLQTFGYVHIKRLVHVHQTFGACTSNVWCMLYIKRLVHVHQTFGACTSNVWCMCIKRLVHVYQTLGACTTNDWCMHVHQTFGA